MSMETHVDYQLNKPVPFNLRVDDELLTWTKQKLELARFPEELADLDDDDWSHGAKVKVVRKLAEYWKDGYDWRAEEVWSTGIRQSTPAHRFSPASLVSTRNSTTSK